MKLAIPLVRLSDDLFMKLAMLLTLAACGGSASELAPTDSQPLRAWQCCSSRADQGWECCASDDAPDWRCRTTNDAGAIPANAVTIAQHECAPLDGQPVASSGPMATIDAATVDAGSDCHVTFSYTSTWPTIQCDAADNCWLVPGDAGSE